MMIQIKVQRPQTNRIHEFPQNGATSFLRGLLKRYLVIEISKMRIIF